MTQYTTQCPRAALAFLLLFIGWMPLRAQSTYGTILGTVKDPSAATVPNAVITITNTGENSSRTVKTNGNGEYQAPNLLPGHYQVNVASAGFESFQANDLTLAARQILRVDALLPVGKSEQTVSVNAAESGVIATDSQTIQATFTPEQLLNLPANIRANGSTSPYQLLQVLPGVQADSSGNFAIQGNTPFMTDYSVDGISTQNVTGNSPLNQAFPSSESIAEIKVQGVGGNAEYGQPGDVTTISKSGANQFHGDLFWYQQNAAFNSLAYGAQEKPAIVANDFGVTAGGPVIIPRLYNGKNKTFFFGTYEGFQFPRAQTIQDQVPTALMRSGNFTGEGVTLVDPTTGQPFSGNAIPQSRISPIAQKFLSTFYPLPNAGNLATAHAANYIENKSANYSSNQYDIRIDQNLTSKQSIFGRWTWKSISQEQAQQLNLPALNNPDSYKLLTLAHNYSLTPSLYNEVRFGFTINDNSTNYPIDGPAFTKALGLEGIGPTFPFNGLPEIDIANFTGVTIDRTSSTSQSKSVQATDNLTWNYGRHTFKFGFDYRYIRALTPLGFQGADNYGTFGFENSFTGNAFGDFLLGLPTTSYLDNVQHDNDGRDSHYAAYAQDTFHVNSRLTLEYGLRFEYNPAYTDAFGDIGNFDPGVRKSGVVIYPTGAQGLLAPGYLQSFNACPVLGSTTGPVVNGAPCTPVLSASQAGLPQGLRTAPRRFMPRFGFAWRPLGNDKTVVRGGFDIYDITTLGSIFYGLTGTLQSNTRTYNNIASNGSPLFQWPQTATGGLGEIAPFGTAYFGTSEQIHFKDPYEMQWNLSVERDLGFQTGLRVSYIGSGTRNLAYSPNLNQSYYSTQPYAAQPLSTRPFPNWGVVNSYVNGATQNYQSVQVEVNHRYQAGLTLNGVYTLAKDLADNQGPNPGSYAGETGGGRIQDYYNRKAGYGDVYGVRRHRFVLSEVYELPFGHGRRFAGNSSAVVNALFGGWQISSILVWQSGPYLTPYFSGGDPSGTGSGIIGRSQEPDRIANGKLANPTRADWFNTGAYVCPGTPGWQPGTPCTIGEGAGSLPPIGRFGNAGISTVEGPGTVALDAGLAKYFNITESVKLKIEGSFTNVLNHTNLADPVLAVDNPSVGQITSARGADFGGSRTGQIGARLEF